MGIRVEFFLGEPARMLVHEASRFLPWYEDYVTDPDSYLPTERDDCVPADSVQIVRGMVDRGESALRAQNSSEAAQIDHIVDTFFCAYCDYGPGRKLRIEAGNTAYHARHYWHISESVCDHASPELAKWWPFLINGRPVGRSADLYPYKPNEKLIRVGFATPDELEALLDGVRDFRRSQHYEPLESDACAMSTVAGAIEDARSESTGLITIVA